MLLPFVAPALAPVIAFVVPSGFDLAFPAEPPAPQEIFAAEITETLSVIPVVEAQHHLADLGWYEGEVDGIKGPLTLRAFEDFADEVGTDPELTAVLAELGPDAPERPEPEPAPAPAPASAPTSGTPWDAIARCESGYGGEPNWSINTGNSFYGGLQFNKPSWDWAVDVGGHSVPEWPHHATREQQIAVAETLLRIHPAGLGAWPACTKKLGLR